MKKRVRVYKTQGEGQYLNPTAQFLKKAQAGLEQQGQQQEQVDPQQLVSQVASMVAPAPYGQGQDPNEIYQQLAQSYGEKVAGEILAAASAYVEQMVGEEGGEDPNAQTEVTEEENQDLLAQEEVMRAEQARQEEQYNIDAATEAETFYDDLIFGDPATEEKRLGGAKKKFIRDTMKLAKKSLGDAGKAQQSSKADSTDTINGRNFNNNNFLSTIQNQATLANIQKQTENVANNMFAPESNFQTGGFTGQDLFKFIYGGGDDPSIPELTKAQVGLQQIRGLSNDLNTNEKGITSFIQGANLNDTNSNEAVYNYLKSQGKNVGEYREGIDYSKVPSSNQNANQYANQNNVGYNTSGNQLWDILTPGNGIWNKSYTINGTSMNAFDPRSIMSKGFNMEKERLGFGHKQYTFTPIGSEQVTSDNKDQLKKDKEQRDPREVRFSIPAAVEKWKSHDYGGKLKGFLGRTFGKEEHAKNGLQTYQGNVSPSSVNTQTANPATQPSVWGDDLKPVLDTNGIPMTGTGDAYTWNSNNTPTIQNPNNGLQDPSIVVDEQKKLNGVNLLNKMNPALRGLTKFINNFDERDNKEMLAQNLTSDNQNALQNPQFRGNYNPNSGLFREDQEGQIWNSKIGGQRPKTGQQYDGALGIFPTKMGGSDIDQYMGKSKPEVQGVLKKVPIAEANLEAEGGETAYGDINGDGFPEHMKIEGPRHTHGGVPLNLPDDTFIFSDTKSMRISDPKILKMFNRPAKKGGYTPADLAKPYDINKYRTILENPDSDAIERKSAELMMKNYNIKLGALAIAQESKKAFPQGIPVVAKAYMEMMGLKDEDLIPQEQEQMNPAMMQQGMMSAEQQASPEEMAMMQQSDSGMQPMDQMSQEGMMQYGGMNYLRRAQNGEVVQPSSSFEIPEGLTPMVKGSLNDFFNYRLNTEKNDINIDGLNNKQLVDYDTLEKQPWYNDFDTQPKTWGQTENPQWNAPYTTRPPDTIYANGGDTFSNDELRRFTDDLYRAQEGMQQPSPEEMAMMQQGQPAPEQGDGDQMAQIVQQVGQALQQGAQPEEVIGQLLQKQVPPEAIAQILVQAGIPQEEVEQLLSSVMQQMQGSQEEVPMAQYGRNMNGYDKPFGFDPQQLQDMQKYMDRWNMQKPLYKDNNVFPYQGKKAVLPSYFPADMLNKYGEPKRGARVTDLEMTPGIGIVSGKEQRGFSANDPHYGSSRNFRDTLRDFTHPGEFNKRKEYGIYNDVDWINGDEQYNPNLQNGGELDKYQSKGEVKSKNKTYKESELPEDAVVKSPYNTDIRIGDFVKQSDGSYLKVAKANFKATEVDTKTRTGTALDFYNKSAENKAIMDEANEIIEREIIKGTIQKIGSNKINILGTLNVPFKEQIALSRAFNSNAELGTNKYKIASQKSTPGYSAGPGKGSFVSGFNPEIYEQRYIFEKARGQGATDDQAYAEVERVLADPKAKAKLRREYVAFLGLKDVPVDDAELLKFDFYKNRYGEVTKGLESVLAKSSNRPALGDDLWAGYEHFDALGLSPDLGYEGLPEEKEKDKNDIDQDEQQILPYNGNAPWWLQDQLKMAGAFSDLMSVNKYYPWAPKYNPTVPEPVFLDPTRAIAAQSEQSKILGDAMAQFSPSAQLASSRLSSLQGQLAKGATDTAHQYDTANVQIANQFGPAQADIYNKAQLYNQGVTKGLYDGTAIMNQQYDNSTRALRNNLLNQEVSGITNAMQTDAMNQMYPQFQVDPSVGGRMHYSGYGKPNRPETSKSLADLYKEYYDATGDREAAAKFAMMEYKKGDNGTGDLYPADAMMSLYGNMKKGGTFMFGPGMLPPMIL